MKKLKVEIGVKQERATDSQKLTFSAQSQEAARKRIEQDKKRQEHVPFRVTPYRNTIMAPPIAPEKSTIYEKLFEPSKEENLVEDQIEEGLAHQAEKDEMDPRQSDARTEEDYPYFPGIYPTFYPTHESFNPEQMWGKRDEANDEEVDETYIDLGPVYTEEAERELEIESRPVEEILLPQTKQGTAGDSLKWLLSIMGAIGLGALFGYLLLVFVLSGDGLANPNRNTQLSDRSAGVTAEGTNTVDLEVKQGGTVTVGKLTVSDRTFYGIQAGAFTEEKTGSEAFANLKAKNVPTLLFEDDVHRLFIGIGYTEQDTINLRQFYRRLGTEIYIKQYTITGATISVPNATIADMEILNKYLTHGTYLLEKTAEWSGLALTGKLEITEEAWRKFKDTHQTFLIEAKELNRFLTEEQKAWTTMMSRELDQAVLKMVEFVESGERDKLVLSQQGLLQYFEAYRSLIHKAGKNVVAK